MGEREFLLRLQDNHRKRCQWVDNLRSVVRDLGFEGTYKDEAIDITG